MVAVGQEAVGFVAIGQLATGVIAIGQLSIGVVSIGQLSRGVISIGQLSCGLFSFGQLSLGGLWSGGMVAVGPTVGAAALPIGAVGRWIPWRRRPGALRIVTRSPWRWAVAALCLAAVVAVSLLPLARELVREGGVFRDPPRVLR